MARKKDDRIRVFATCVYPESAPDNWRDIVVDTHISGFISPLHDSDLNPTGEAKKPHYHVMFQFEGKKSDEQVREIFESFGGVGLERVNSLRGMARYLCHLDNPEKHRYDASDVTCLAGADYYEVISLISDMYSVLRDILLFIERYNITNFRALFMWASLNNDAWYRALASGCSFVVKEYLKSKSWDNSDINSLLRGLPSVDDEVIE